MTASSQNLQIDFYGHDEAYYQFTASGYPPLISAASGTVPGTVVNPGTADPTGTQSAFLGTGSSPSSPREPKPPGRSERSTSRTPSRACARSSSRYSPRRACRPAAPGRTPSPRPAWRSPWAPRWSPRPPTPWRGGSCDHPDTRPPGVAWGPGAGPPDQPPRARPGGTHGADHPAPHDRAAPAAAGRRSATGSP